MKKFSKDLDECKEEVFFDIFDQFGMLQYVRCLQKIVSFLASLVKRCHKSTS